MMKQCSFNSTNYTLPEHIFITVSGLEPKKWVKQIVKKDPRYELLIELYQSMVSQKERIPELFDIVAPKAIAAFKKRAAMKTASEKAQGQFSVFVADWEKGAHKIQSKLSFSVIPKDILLEIIKYLGPKDCLNMRLVEKYVGETPFEQVIAANFLLMRLFMKNGYLIASEEFQAKLHQNLTVVSWSISDKKMHKIFVERISNFTQIHTLYLSTTQYTTLDEAVNTCTTLPSLKQCIIDGGPFVFPARHITYPSEAPKIKELEVRFQSLSFKAKADHFLYGQVACFLKKQEQRCTQLKEVSFENANFSEMSSLMQFPINRSVEMLTFIECTQLNHQAVVLLLHEVFPSVKSMGFSNFKESIPSALFEQFSPPLVKIAFSNSSTISEFPDLQKTHIEEVDIEGCPQFGDEGLASLAKTPSIQKIRLSNVPKLTSAESLFSFPEKQLKEVSLPASVALCDDRMEVLKKREPALQIEWTDELVQISNKRLAEKSLTPQKDTRRQLQFME